MVDDAPTILPAQTDAEYVGDVTLHDVECRPDEVVGKVTNNSPVRFSISITVYEDDATGTQLDDRLTAVHDLGPGRTGRWTSWVLVDDYAACSVVINGISD